MKPRINYQITWLSVGELPLFTKFQEESIFFLDGDGKVTDFDKTFNISGRVQVRFPWIRIEAPRGQFKDKVSDCIDQVLAQIPADHKIDIILCVTSPIIVDSKYCADIAVGCYVNPVSAPVDPIASKNIMLKQMMFTFIRKAAKVT